MGEGFPALFLPLGAVVVEKDFEGLIDVFLL